MTKKNTVITAAVSRFTAEDFRQAEIYESEVLRYSILLQRFRDDATAKEQASFEDLESCLKPTAIESKGESLRFNIGEDATIDVILNDFETFQNYMQDCRFKKVDMSYYIELMNDLSDYTKARQIYLDMWDAQTRAGKTEAGNSKPNNGIDFHVRAVTIDGREMFFASDICKIFDIKRPYDVTRNLPDSVKDIYDDGHKRRTVVTSIGVYLIPRPKTDCKKVARFFTWFNKQYESADN